MDTEIGIVTMKYDESGKVLEAKFISSPVINLVNRIDSQLEKIESSDDKDKIKSNADMVLAAWFSHQNDIELSDKFDTSIVSEYVNCEKYPSGMIRICQIKYIFKQ